MNRRRGIIIIAVVIAAVLLIIYGLLLLPFLSGTQLAKSVSPDGACAVYVVDGGPGCPVAIGISLLDFGQHIYLWRRWRLFPHEIGATKNYGDLASFPECKITWSRRTAKVVITSDEGGTDRLTFNTR